MTFKLKNSKKSCLVNCKVVTLIVHKIFLISLHKAAKWRHKSLIFLSMYVLSKESDLAVPLNFEQLFCLPINDSFIRETKDDIIYVA